MAWVAGLGNAQATRCRNWSWAFFDFISHTLVFPKSEDVESEYGRRAFHS